MTVFYPILRGIDCQSWFRKYLHNQRLEYIFVHALDLQSRESAFFENVDLFSGQKGTQ